MLGKLIKHELRGSGRTMLPFILVSLFLSVMAGLSMRAMEHQQDYSWFNILFGIVIFLFVAGLMAVCIMSVVVVINRFRQNLLGDEGYLMFTLPVSVDQHIWAKLIVSAIWFLATALTCMLAVVLVLLCNVRTFDVNWSEVGYVMGELGRVIREFGILHIVGYCLELLVMFFAGVCVSCLTFYCAMAIGYSFANRKVLLSVLAFFGLDIFFSMVQSALIAALNGMPGVERFLDNLDLSQVGTAGSVHIVMLCWILYLAVYAAVLYIPTRLLLKKKLNLP
ncbi:MAG: hypothetical protein ACI3VD_10025 [Candidatus Limivicinus sp.]